MATVKLAGPFAEISGKLGKLVFASTKEGTVMRDRTTPTNPKTPAQIAVRNAFRKATKQWSTLSAANMAAWKSYATAHPKTNKTSGEQYTPSAFNWFAALATKYFLVNPNATSAPLTPPATNFGGDSLSFTITNPVGSNNIQFTASAANSAGVTTELLVQSLASAGRSPSKSGYRSKGFKAFATGSLSTTVAVSTGYFAAAYRYVNTATGQELGTTFIGTLYVAGAALRSGDNSSKPTLKVASKSTKNKTATKPKALKAPAAKKRAA